MDWEDTNPVEEIFSEVSGARHTSQVAVRRSNDSHVVCTINNVTESANLLVLENPQQLDLEPFRCVGNLIEKERSPVRLFEQATLVRHSRRKGATLVPKEFAFDKIFWQRAAVNRNEAASTAMTPLMNRTRNQFLAATSFTLNQDRTHRLRGDVDPPA